MRAPDDPVDRVFRALCAGELRRADLTARKLAAFLGASTTVLYHHYGSVDGFLIRVDGAAWALLVETLRARDAAGASLEDLALAYLDFAFLHPDLYGLMTAHPFDRVALRDEGRLSRAEPLVAAFAALLRRHGSRRPREDVHALFASLHGLASLALSGRTNLAGVADGDQARATARRLVRAIVPPARATRR